jgi:meso-butanediol dehydrogenase / (S,S)-butanediol dehydrogenase / diacetyl reductase
MSVARDVLVVVGAGGLGRAIAAELGPGRVTVLADADPDALEVATMELADQGLDVVPCPVDVTDPGAVRGLVAAAEARGPVRQLVHTAGVMPGQADVPTILEVDLVGPARVLEYFGPVLQRGGSACVVAGMAAYMGLDRLTEDQGVALGLIPADELLEMSCTHPTAFTSPLRAYGFAKHANVLRVRATATVWRDRGVRVNSVSPGIVATALAHQELNGEHGVYLRKLAENSPVGRVGTVREVTRAIEFLMDPRSSYITGTDVLVDGGVTAALQMEGSPA